MILSPKPPELRTLKPKDNRALKISSSHTAEGLCVSPETFHKRFLMKSLGLGMKRDCSDELIQRGGSFCHECEMRLNGERLRCKRGVNMGLVEPHKFSERKCKRFTARFAGGAPEREPWGRNFRGDACFDSVLTLLSLLISNKRTDAKTAARFSWTRVERIGRIS
jgi:hypothetical protein